MLDQLYSRLEEIYPEMVDFRRDLHMYPELSFTEVDTPNKIASYLTALGLEVKTGVGGRGVVGYLKGGKPGKTVALRADFDALPIQDEKDVPYKSKVPGVMHACGHDIHTAALLGVAKVLSEHRESIEGNVVFIHQFAEELAPGGAKPMIEDGCLEGVDVIYGAHVWSACPVGEVEVKEGFTMAASDAFDIDIQGKGGHGATPHLTVDSIVVASQLVLNIQQIVSRKVDPLKPAVVTVGSLNSGIAFNVIPDKAKLTGTVRTFDDDVRDLIEKELEHITKKTCEQAGASADFTYKRGYPAVWNHPEETDRVERLAQSIVGEKNVRRRTAIMGGEDFAYYLQHVPGTFFFVGGGNAEIDAVYPHHHPMFNVDEKSMLVTGKCFLASVFDYLASTNTISEQAVIER
ncbi:M20 family metallopeptidase [Bacillus horti]|uniref:Amidohydrolase n=1 Tax=Caldalkalibacillus horti TaxID=77523 RepID=A0ABT9W022_9BACI|nr:M20 family metallopeptidase [Bacillus horti]MDQ0166598.1 amidohydrolase [Bacillus horti]